MDEKREQFVSSLHCSEQIFSSLSRIDDAIKQIEQVANGDGVCNANKQRDIKKERERGSESMNGMCFPPYDFASFNTRKQHHNSFYHLNSSNR